MKHYFDSHISTKPLLFFITILIVMNGFLMALYFSGNAFLHSIIVPEMSSLESNSWREFGLLEMIQNALLIAIIIILFSGVRKSHNRFDKALYFLGMCAFTFLLLEEVDYGLHYYELVTGEVDPDAPRNWHNELRSDGEQNVDSMKRVIDGLSAFLFFLLPLLCFIKPIGKHLKGRAFVPVLPFVYAVVVAIVLSRLTHWLDDNNYAEVSGARGLLDNNISEFREMSMYYIYLLYAFQLVSFKGFLSKEKIN